VEQAPQPVTVFQETTGTSGIVGGGGDFIDKHKLMTTKSLEYWSVCLVVNLPFCSYVDYFSFLIAQRLKIGILGI
jgi:hypothetical protein